MQKHFYQLGSYVKQNKYIFGMANAENGELD